MRIALLQCAPDNSPPNAATISRSLDKLSQSAKLASHDGANVVVTPELFLTGYDIGPAATCELAQLPDSPVVNMVAAIAREHQIAIVLGLALRHNTSQDSPLSNSALLIDAQGHTVLRYDKVQLFGTTDRQRFSAGQRLSGVVSIGQAKVALAICYDIEFPELVRHLAIAGAQIILVPTANMKPYTSVPERLVPARAEENAVFIGYANYCGPEGQFDYTGLSCLVGPDGEDLARAGTDEQMLLSDIDLTAIDLMRGTLDYLDDRRADLYDSHDG